MRKKAMSLFSWFMDTDHASYKPSHERLTVVLWAPALTHIAWTKVWTEADAGPHSYMHVGERCSKAQMFQDSLLRKQCTSHENLWVNTKRGEHIQSMLTSVGWRILTRRLQKDTQFLDIFTEKL